MDKPIAWYDPTNRAVSRDKDSPLFTPLGQLLPLYTKQEDDGITLTTIRHPRGKPALGNLNPESLETMEIDVPVPVAIYRAGQTKGEVYHVQFLKEMAADEVLLYAAPVQRTRIELTDDEIQRIRTAVLKEKNI